MQRCSLCLTRDRVRDGDEGLADPRAQAPVHARGEVHVAAADLPGGVRGARRRRGLRCRGRGGGRCRPGGRRPCGPGRGRAAGTAPPPSARPPAGDHVVAVIDRLDRGEHGGVEAGLLAGQASHGRRHLIRGQRRPSHRLQVIHRGCQPFQGVGHVGSGGQHLAVLGRLRGAGLDEPTQLIARRCRAAPRPCPKRYERPPTDRPAKRQEAAPKRGERIVSYAIPRRCHTTGGEANASLPSPRSCS